MGRKIRDCYDITLRNVFPYQKKRYHVRSLKCHHLNEASSIQLGVTKVQVAQTSQILLQVREAVEIFYTQDRVCRFFPAEGLC